MTKYFQSSKATKNRNEEVETVLKEHDMKIEYFTSTT